MVSEEGTSAPSPAPGLGGSAGGRGGCGRNNHGGQNRRGGRGMPQWGQAKINGNAEDMNGHVVQCYNESSNKKQFAKTVEALGEYIAKNKKFLGDMLPLTKELKQPTLDPPEDLLEGETSQLKLTIREKRVASYCTYLDCLDSNLKSAYTVIWGQCSKAKLKSLEKFEERNAVNNCVWLLKEIQAITYQFEGQRYIFLSLDVAYTTFYTYRQGPDEALADYLHQFHTNVEVLEHYGGNNRNHPALLTKVQKGLPKLASDA